MEGYTPFSSDLFMSKDKGWLGLRLRVGKESSLSQISGGETDLMNELDFGKYSVNCILCVDEWQERSRIFGTPKSQGSISWGVLRIT